ncbi:MAG: ABC transporter ATP-binding protein [Bacteroidales bacterium]|nr:ABC transporter ATP-binding protein [Bacteroidales bacterium]
MTPYIEIHNLTKVYGQIRAVDDLSMKVMPGDIYGFLGPNGSGKSTTIRMMLSLIHPTAGQILLFGHDLAKDRYKTLSRLGALIEKPDFYNYLTARKNLEILGKLSGISNLKFRVDEVLEQVGLLSRATSKVQTFSLGMKQRLGIAQSLLHHPDLIILDEPTNGLDPQGQKEIRDLVKSLNQEHHITILISSHILFEIEQIANRMVIINRGKALVEGHVQELINSQDRQVAFVIADVPAGLAALNETTWAGRIIKSNHERISFKINKEEIPELNAFLVEHQIEIFAIEPVRSLEEFFLEITDHGEVN